MNNMIHIFIMRKENSLVLGEFTSFLVYTSAPRESALKNKLVHLPLHMDEDEYRSEG